jgi:uncharacterized membrane protein YeaQ/YmgE (transglycosylase-associated protein family)
MDLQVTTIIALIVGGIAGWAVAKILRHKGFSVFSFTIVGLLGGFLGNFLWGLFHTAGSLDLYHTLASSAVGGIVLVLLWRLIR